MPFENIDNPVKAIYEYDRGDKVVKADPHVIWRKIHAACVKLSQPDQPPVTWGGLCDEWKKNVDEKIALGKYSEETAGAWETNGIAWNLIQGKICAVAYEVFGAQPIDEDGKGLNEDAIFKILNDFLDYREKKDETASASPASSTPTAGRQTMSSRSSLGGRSGMKTSSPLS
jgi:hypothetical protein